MPPTGALASPAMIASRSLGQPAAGRKRCAAHHPATARITPSANAPPVGLVHSAPPSSTPLTTAERARPDCHASTKKAAAPVIYSVSGISRSPEPYHAATCG